MFESDAQHFTTALWIEPQDYRNVFNTNAHYLVNFDKSRKSLLAKAGCWHGNRNKNHLLAEMLVFRNDES